jgi:hypothetical protein
MNIVVLNKTYNVEIAVRAGSTQQQIFFPQINVLDGALTTGIETYIPEIIPTAPSGLATANSALMSVTYLNLIVGDVLQVWNLPLLKLVTLNAPSATGVGSSPFSTEFDNLKIIWAKSYIFISDVSKISGSVQESFNFNINYADIPQPQ